MQVNNVFELAIYIDVLLSCVLNFFSRTSPLPIHFTFFKKSCKLMGTHVYIACQQDWLLCTGWCTYCSERQCDCLCIHTEACICWTVIIKKLWMHGRTQACSVSGPDGLLQFLRSLFCVRVRNMFWLHTTHKLSVVGTCCVDFVQQNNCDFGEFLFVFCFFLHMFSPLPTEIFIYFGRHLQNSHSFANWLNHSLIIEIPV